MSLSSLCSQLAFFSESNPAPRALLLFSSQGPTRKKQRGRGSQHSEMSELMLAVPLRTSLSPHREFSPVLFTCSDQHPSAAASNLVLFGGSNDGEIGTCHWRFQMRRSCWARTTIYPGDWFFSLDLKDAYFYIQIAPYHRQFLRFAFEGVAYQYTVLPFGLSLATRTFTKCLNYLDDWLIFAQSESLALSKCFKGCWASWPQHLQYFSWACFSTG